MQPQTAEMIEYSHTTQLT